MALNRKCAFAVFAQGDMYKRFRERLVGQLGWFAPGVDVVDLNMDDVRTALPGLTDSDIPKFSRLSIPMSERFEKYDRVVWVDCDTEILSGMFAGVLEVETSDDGLAASPDMRQERRKAELKRYFQGRDIDVYVNSGVLVMDLDKIDKKSWHDRVSLGISIHAAKTFRFADQDLINGLFNVKVIDQRYNSIWRESSVDNAWLVHYADNQGHKALLEKIESGHEKTGVSLSSDRCVAIAPRHAFIRPWIRAYFASGNTLPLVIMTGPDGDWKEGDLDYCKAAAAFCGGMVLDCSEEWKNSARLAQRSSLNKMIGWYTKKSLLRAVATRVSPKAWAWVDDDVEITGDLSECFDYAESRPGFICSQFYRPGKTDSRPAGMFRLYRGDKLCWNSLVFFHNDANARLTDKLSKDYPIEDDEIIFGYLYNVDQEWHDGFRDFSHLGWQTVCKSVSDIPKDWNGKAIHYASRRNGWEVKKMWEAKVSELPPAPFECLIGNMDSLMSGMMTSKAGIPDDLAVDAVFVIGKGSKNGNEELRYALRSLDTNCPFVRDVYICGDLPPFVNTDTVRHIPWPDKYRHAKDANIIDKLRRACSEKGMARRVLFCSDDQFQTHVCSWEDFAPRWLRRYDPSDTWYTDMKREWHTRLRDTLERDAKRRRDAGLDDTRVFYYEPHMWMQIDRDLFLKYAEWSDYANRSDTIIASGYFNFIDAGGSQIYDHRFICENTKDIPDVTHIAYTDGVFKKAMEFAGKLFPSACRFERGFKGASAREAEPSPETHAATRVSDAPPRSDTPLLVGAFGRRFGRVFGFSASE